MRRLEQTVIAGFGAALVLLSVISVAAYRSIRELIDESDWVAHTHEVLKELEHVPSQLKDAQRGERGYLLTHDVAFLDPYHRAAAAARSELADLRRLTADNADQQARLDRLEPMVEALLAKLDEIIKLHDTIGPQRAVEEMRKGEGNELLNNVLDLVREMEAEEARLLEHRLRSVHGAARWTHVIIVAGSLLAMAVVGWAAWIINREIGRRKRVSDALRRAQTELERRVEERTLELRRTATELQRSNRELQEFAYIASHDLQEPLRTVTSYCQLLARRYQGKLDKDADDFIGFAVDAAKWMQSLIQALLEYSRVGTEGVSFARVDCDDVLQRVLATLRAKLDETAGIVTADPLPSVHADATQLTQLFQNLLGNALKFRGKDAPRVHVGAESRGAEWLFAVKDNGIGIPPAQVHRLFGLFQRLHRDPRYPGTGIGLAICKKIVERHGGSIWIESSESGGSTFFFTLPRLEASA